mgnify:CR=1 FL=1
MAPYPVRPARPRPYLDFLRKVSIGNEFKRAAAYDRVHFYFGDAGLSSLGVPGVPRHTQILADQLTLFQPGGTNYAHLITTGTPGFSDLPTALPLKIEFNLKLSAQRL